MGRIVRGAKVVDQAYVVAVPELVPPSNGDARHELDDRFVTSGDALAFDDPDRLFGDDAAYDAEPCIDIEQVRADARALVDAAAADAEAMLRDAAARAKTLVERANANVNDIEAQARTRGRDEGLEAGRAAGQAEFDERIAAMHELITSAREQRNTIVEGAEPELVRLAMAIAERIVYDHVAIDPNVVIENVRHALTRLVGREVVTLRVNPADLEILRQYRDSISSSNDVEHLRIVEDQRVDRGGVVIETDSGTIDAKIGTQLREARRALTNGDTIAQAS